MAQFPSRWTCTRKVVPRIQNPAAIVSQPRVVVSQSSGLLMGEHGESNFTGLSLELARRIDAVCRRFEADWQRAEVRGSRTTPPTFPTRAESHCGRNLLHSSTSFARRRSLREQLAEEPGRLPRSGRVWLSRAPRSQPSPRGPLRPLQSLTTLLIRFTTRPRFRPVAIRPST